MKTVDWFSKTSSPVALLCVSTIEVTAAALPLSRTSSRRAELTRVPLVGIGPLIERYCSPWRSLACSEPEHVSQDRPTPTQKKKRPLTGLKLGKKSIEIDDEMGNCGMTPKLGSAEKLSSFSNTH